LTLFYLTGTTHGMNASRRSTRRQLRRARNGYTIFEKQNL
jgi:hypothetical protein